jgi:O-antigen/teichoic acid export membrane protein
MAKTGLLLLKGGLLRIGETAVQMGVAFFMMPLMIRSLGDHLYGVWAVVGGLVATYHLLDLGFAAAVTRYVAKHIAAGEDEETNRVVSTALVIYTVLALVILLITFGGMLAVEKFVEPPDQVPMVQAVVLLCGFSMALEFPFKAFAGIANAHLRYDLLAMSRMFWALVNAVTFYWLLTHGYQIVAMATTTLVVSVCSNITFYAIARHVHHPLRVRFSYVQRSYFRTLYGYSIWSFVTSLAQLLRTASDNFVIAGFLSSKAVTHYSVGQRLSEYAVQIQMQATNTLAPLFTRYHTRGDTRELHNKVVFMTKLNTLLACFCAWMLVLLGDVFIRRWIGKEGFEDAYGVLCLLAVGFGTLLTFNSLNNAMYAIARLKRPALMELLEAGVKFALCIALVKPLGLYGVALGTAIPLVVFSLGVRPWVACHELEMPLRRHYAAVLPLVGVTGVFALLTHLFVQPYLPVSYGAILVVPLILMPPFMLLCLNLFFDSFERKLLVTHSPEFLRPLVLRLFLRRPDLNSA